MAYDVILLTFSKPLAAVLKQRSMWQQMSGSRRAGYTFDSHSRTQRKGYDKMGQVRERLSSLDQRSRACNRAYRKTPPRAARGCIR